MTRVVALLAKAERMRIVLPILMLALLSPALGCKSIGFNGPGTSANKTKKEQTAQEVAIDAIKKRGGLVQVESDDLQKVVVLVDLHNFRNPNAALETLVPLTKLRELNLCGSGFTDADLQRLSGLNDLQELNLSGTKITDNGLAVLQTLPNLSTLHLDSTSISDNGLALLRSLPHLQTLTLYQTKVTDAGLAQLRSMENLQKLTLGGSAITDKGMMTLASLPQLRDLTLLSTKVSKSAVEDLKIASTQLKINNY